MESKTKTAEEINQVSKMEKKQLFIIDGYKIWAISYEKAYENYLQILKF